MTLQTPLAEEHLRLGAKLVDFGGWDMPLQYQGVISEHTAVRERAGLFDVSHLGKLIVEGADAEPFLDGVLPGKVAALAPWRAGYNLVLHDEGGIVDDIFVYRHPEYFIVVPNASNSDRVMNHLLDRVEGDVSVTQGRERWAILALSGPEARRIAAKLWSGVSDLKMHTFAEAEIEGVEVLVARTGYTGEYTCEFFVAWPEAATLWNSLLRTGADAGVTPAGLGARDTLRLEMGYPLYGHEIDDTTNPIEAGLSWVVQWDKDFRNKEVLERLRSQPLERQLVGLVARGREIPRQHHRILLDGREVGRITSGNFSPVLKRGIAMGYVEPDLAGAGTMLAVEVRSKTLPVEVRKPPFIRG